MTSDITLAPVPYIPSQKKRLPPFPLAAKTKTRAEFSHEDSAPRGNETRKIISSSEGMGWSGMLGMQARPYAMERKVPSATHLFFAVPLENQQLAIEIDGHLYEGQLSVNSHAIVAPGAQYTLNLLDSAEHFYLYIKNDVLADVANELFGKRLDAIDMHSPVEASDRNLQYLLNACMHMLKDTQDSSFRSDYMARAIVAEYYTKHTQLRQVPQLAESKVPLSSMQVQRVHDYMQAHLHASFQIADLAASIGMSRTIFFERFVHTVKKTPNQYLQILRVNRARQLLADRKLSLADIAFACGYADQSHFARFFKRFVGVTPGKYRVEISS
jgi:AraC family transcriptional regulator